ncbi:hypothetical protein AWN76_004795 [Rhodothermaceae bacterium RA]|nr:hypothetical protein AWN76_004795 [Rhodothermaceae bacterium RA]
MLHIQTILHPTDFSASARAALAQALFLARRYEATLHLLHVTPLLGDDPLRGAFEAGIDEEAFYRRQWEAADRQLQALVAEAEGGGVPIKRVTTRGNAPGDVIDAYARAEDVDLIVMGTHGRRGLRHMLLGSVAEEVVRRADAPVMTVRAPEDAAPPADVKVDRILAPIDFSAASLRALRYARELAALYGASVDVLHIIEPARYPAFYQLDPAVSEDVLRPLEDVACSRLEALFAQAGGPEAPATFHARVGYPPRDLLEAADALGTDLIVMATHGLQGHRRFALGSVTERIVRGAPCPVFVTKPYGKSLLPAAFRAAVPVEASGAQPT